MLPVHYGVLKEQLGMYVIAAIGLTITILSLMMAVSPAAWSRGILSFAQKPYFHVSEILTRLILGATLLLFSSQTLFPLFINVVGGIFIFAGIVLVGAGEKRHREFAIKSASFVRIFRPAGVAGALFGAFFVYTAIT